jgi:hypothetical protein
VADVAFGHRHKRRDRVAAGRRRSGGIRSTGR